MRGLPSILSLFLNELNKFNNTRARMLDSLKVSKVAKIRNRYNQVPHLTQTSLKSIKTSLKYHFCLSI